MEKILKYIEDEKDIFTKAKLIKSAVYQKHIRIIELARFLGKNPSYICHLIRLASLPEMVIDGYYAGLVSISHLFIISRIKDHKKLIAIYEKILKDNYSVQQTEEAVREILYDVKDKGERLKDTDIENLVKKIKTQIENIKIKISQTRIKGKINIEIKGDLETTSSIIKKILEKLSQS